MNLTEARETGDDIVTLLDDLADDETLRVEDRMEILARIANAAGQRATRLTIAQARADGLIPRGML